MKRKDLLKKLKAAGFQFEEGGEHTRVLKGNTLITVVPRHTEVSENTARKILKDAGLR